MEERIALGRIGRAHGLSGAFRVWPYANNLDRFSLLKEVVLTHGSHTLRAVVENVRPVKGCVIVQTKEITKLEDVQPWVHGDVEIDASERIALPEGQYFHEDILGLRVETASGDKVGTIVSILENAANDVYVCRNGEAEYLIPAVDEFIKQIDIPNGVMIIQPIAGMLE